MEQLCPWESAQYFVYSSNIPTLFFYSHIPAILVAMFTGLFVYYRTSKSKIGSSLLVVSILFSLWNVFDLIIWATNRPDVVLFFWSLQILFEPLVYLMCFYLIYLFIKGKDLLFKWKLLGVLLYLPVAMFLPFKYNLIGVDISYCNAVEGFIAQYFTYVVESVFILSIILLVIIEYRKIYVSDRRKEIIIFGLGVILFLIAFSSGNVIGSFTDNWNLAQAGLIGMPIFVAFFAYMIVKFRTFNIRLIGAQALIFALGFLVLAILFIRRIENIRIVVVFTLLFVVVLGYALIKSVKKEVKQKEELAKLNTDLQDLLKQRESLVHLVTHKVKGSFTRSKYIFDGMISGMFGEINQEVRKRAEQGLESDNMGIETVDLVLNAANLQKGTIKYEMKPLDFKQMVLKTVAEKKISAEAKGLTLEMEITEDVCSVLGDSFWLKEALNNLVENSVRYTLQGKITVGLKKDDKKIVFYVRDTGVGITEEDKGSLFTEGGRGKDSVKINVDSTGYGLYSVRLILNAHKGKIWMSPNKEDGRGTIFFIELDAA